MNSFLCHTCLPFLQFYLCVPLLGSDPPSNTESMAMSTQTSSTSAPPAVENYDVLLSSGGKSCKDFVDYLCRSLLGRGITVFTDKETTATSILTTTKISRFAIVVLSRDYASSTCCLDKLSTILQCMRGRIFPIFYKAEPSDLRFQKGCIEIAFDMFETVEDMTKVKRWRTALREVSSISGWVLTDLSDIELIERIVQLCCDLCNSSQNENGNLERPNLWPLNDCPCPSNEGDDRNLGMRTPRCYSCKRLQPRDTGYLDLFDDGPYLCPECEELAVTVTEECESLTLDHDMKLEHQNQITLQLVGRHPVGDYNVLLSFSRETCKDFTDHLYKALQWQGITVFMDDAEHTDTCISTATINSRFAIVVLSQPYASSTCCLDKLSTISQCMRGRIFPIFYKAEPSDIRHQKGSLKRAFDNFETLEDMTKVKRWRTALREVCSISGWASTHCDTELTKEIVEHFYKLRCEVCHDWRSFISADSSRVGYMEHPFWRQYYCHSHEGDGTSKCCSCDRLEPMDTHYLLLHDGRYLCPQCQESAIFDTDKRQSLYLDVQKFYDYHNLRLGNQIPALQLVDRVDHRATKGEGDQNSLCCEAKEILIWYGFPRLLTGSLVAQEMMKTWITGTFYPDFKLSIEDEKGICAVIARSWLDYSSKFESDSSKQLSEFEKKLVEFRKYQIDSSHYGEAFSTIKQAVHNYGLSGTLLQRVVPLLHSNLVKSRHRVYTSGPSANPWKYDLFLSFRGETRDGFTAGLYKALKEQGINVFMDSEIEKGAFISDTLFTAIKQSRFAMPVLSQNYASSTWCLKELSDAFGCTSVFPIFYHVHPSNVRTHTDSFAQPFEKYREKFKLDEAEVRQWETALTEVGRISGWHIRKQNGLEVGLFRRIAKEVYERLVCGGCNMRINEPSYFNCLHRVWHRECFCCYACDLPFTDREFWACGFYPFHQSCHKLRCEVCKYLTPENTDDEIEYMEHPSSSQKYRLSREYITEEKLVPRPLNSGLEHMVASVQDM